MKRKPSDAGVQPVCPWHGLQCYPKVYMKALSADLSPQALYMLIIDGIGGSYDKKLAFHQLKSNPHPSTHIMILPITPCLYRYRLDPYR